MPKSYGKNECFTRKTMKKEKEICTSFAIEPSTARVAVTVHDKGLVKVEKQHVCGWMTSRKLTLIDSSNY